MSLVIVGDLRYDVEEDLGGRIKFYEDAAGAEAKIARNCSVVDRSARRAVVPGLPALQRRALLVAV
jgi:hypothetical protein